MDEREEGRGAGGETAVRTIVVMWLLVPVFLIGLVMATIVMNPTLIIAFLGASIAFAIAAIIASGIYGFNRLIEYVSESSKRG